MLVSDWKHTKSSMVHHLRSLINFSQALPLHYRRLGGKRGSITIVGLVFSYNLLKLVLSFYYTNNFP